MYDAGYVPFLACVAVSVLVLSAVLGHHSYSNVLHVRRTVRPSRFIEKRCALDLVVYSLTSRRADHDVLTCFVSRWSCRSGCVGISRSSHSSVTFFAAAESPPMWCLLCDYWTCSDTHASLIRHTFQWQRSLHRFWLLVRRIPFSAAS